MPFTRKVDLIACLLGCLALGAAYYLEIVVGLEPCPLCIIQRIILLILTILFLLGTLFPLINLARRLYHFFVFIIAGLGVAVAGWHVWLTTLPREQVPPCEASIYIMLKYMPFKQVVNNILQAGGDCSNVSWHFLNLNLPTWSLITFTILMLIAVWQVVHKDRIWIE